MAGNNWTNLPSTSDPVKEAPSPSHPAPTTLPIWIKSIDPRLFPALAASSATSELANALVMPPIGEGTHLPSGSSGSPVISSNVQVIQADGERERPEERPEVEAAQVRVCSVRACKQTVPVGYEYKMCPACRVRYQKYGTTKRAKWKVAREKEKEKENASGVSEDSREVPRILIQPSDEIEAARKPTMPLATSHLADESPTPVGTNIEAEVPTDVTERDNLATTAPNQHPSVPSADELDTPSVQPELLPQMHKPPPYSSPNVTPIHEQVPRPSSNSSAASYLESDPVVNGFSKFRVELFEGELNGSHTEGTVMSAPDVMKLGEPSKTRASASLLRTVGSTLSGEDHVKGASGTESGESASPADGNITRHMVPVSLTVCHPVTSEPEIQAVASNPSQVQNDNQSQSTQDGPSSQPPSTTPVPAPKTKRKRKAKPKVAATGAAGSTTPSTSRPPALPPQPHPGYPAPHPYLYPYYPMYFPPYPGAYQYPYLPMPFAAPPPRPQPPHSPPPPAKSKRKRKPSLADVARSISTPTPIHPGIAYPYPPGHSGEWAYPTPPLPPPITESLSQESANVGSVDPVPPPQPPQPMPAPPPTSAVYTISAPYSLPAHHPPSQSPSPPTPPVPHYPHISGTQPYSGTPLTTLMPVPIFPVETNATFSSGGSRKGKSKEVGKEDDVAAGKESYEIHVRKQPHVQMQFNYYHYGMGSSQSPTTPELHAKKKRRKVDPNYREKLEKFRTQGLGTAIANPDSATTAPQPDLNPSISMEKQAVGKGDLGEELSSTPILTLRQCSNKGCKRTMDGTTSTICNKCKTKFKKMAERTKERFRLVPKQTVCDILAK